MNPSSVRAALPQQRPSAGAVVRRLVVPTANGPQHVAHWARAAEATPACSVVLVHGLADNACVWQGIAGELARGADVYAPDLRGHGTARPAEPGPGLPDEMAADLLGLVSALELQRPWLVGHSLGAALALRVAAEHPRRFGGVVLIDYAPEVSDAILPRLRAGLLESHRPYASVADYAAVLKRRHLLADPDLIDAIALGSLRSTPSGLQPTFDPAMVEAVTQDGPPEGPAERWALLRRLDLPALIVRGAWSWIVPQDTARQMAEACPQGRLAVVPMAGHSVQIDNPQGLLAALAGLPFFPSVSPDQLS